MKNEFIEICGVTPSCDFPQCEPDYPCTEICETDKLCIPCKKPDIKEILQVWVSISVCSTKTICTPVGKKLVINGIKHVKIMYTANRPCQNVHCAHFEVPFCSFILLKHWCYKIIDICTAIEHVCVHQLNSRCFSLSTIIFICPIFKKKYSYSNHCEKKHHCCEDDIFTNLDMSDTDCTKKPLNFYCEDDVLDKHSRHDNKYDDCYDDDYDEDCCKPSNESYYFSNCYEEDCPQNKYCLDENDD